MTDCTEKKSFCQVCGYRSCMHPVKAASPEGEIVFALAEKILEAATNVCADPDGGPDDETSIRFTGNEGCELANALFSLSTPPTSERAEVVALLSNPNAVHLNMLRGGIAKLTPSQVGHLYRGGEAVAVVSEVQRQNPEAFARAPAQQTDKLPDGLSVMPEGGAISEGLSFPRGYPHHLVADELHHVVHVQTDSGGWATTEHEAAPPMNPLCDFAQPLSVTEWCSWPPPAEVNRVLMTFPAPWVEEGRMTMIADRDGSHWVDGNYNITENNDINDLRDALWMSVPALPESAQSPNVE